MAYESTVATPLSKCERISRSLGILAGKCNIPTYNTSLLTITAITRYFVTGNVLGFTQGIIAVVPQGASSNGYLFEWDYATGAFKCYTPTAATIAVDSALSGASLLFDSGGGAAALHATSAVGNITYAGVAAEASDGDDCGEVAFIAIGFIR